jgi:hypothetical protein
VKSREKDCPEPADRAVADLFRLDRGYHPSTLLELLAVADCCVHVFSVAALEAAYAGVPALCFVPPTTSTFFDQAHTWARITADQLRGPETVWAFPGVSQAVDLDDAAETLRSQSLSALRVDPDRRRAYLDGFLGPSNGGSARRVLQAALQAVEAAR